MISMHWFLPTGGDSRDVLPGDENLSHREPSHQYLLQVALAAEQAGFDAMLTPCGTGCEDAWITTAMLVPKTSRIRFLVAFRPGLLSPTLAAQMASSYQRMSGGRVLLNIVTGAEPAELARFGDFADKSSRYERCAEFMEIMKASWGDQPFDYQGDHYRVQAATTRLAPDPVPKVFFGGASEPAENAAARGADVYLFWGETPEMILPRLASVRDKAAALGRELEYGIRFHVIARETSKAAWEFAENLVSNITDDAVGTAQQYFTTTQSEGQRRMADMHGGDRAKLTVYPNVWAGIGLVRGGAGTALVGSYYEVAERIEEYAGLGLTHFILSGYPHLEECHHFGEGVMPILRQRGLVAGTETSSGPIFHFR